MTILKSLFIVLALSLISSPLYADKLLDLKKAQKQEVTASMIGFRNTLLFYTFKDQKAILVLSIDNKDETFPVTGKVYLFDESANEEALAKWINNQHSDGLYPDIPEPIATVELPKETCKVSSHKQTGTSENPGPVGGEVKDYEVNITIKAFESKKKFKLSAFKETTKVHIIQK
jgi:hypothetical protein